MVDLEKNLTSFVAARLRVRNTVSRTFFADLAAPLANLSRRMALRFLEGGRLFAFGRGAYATDAQHVSVEFVHPVIVGKRALPACDASAIFEAGLQTLLSPHDMVLGFGPPSGDASVAQALARSQQKEVLTIALPGSEGDFFLAPASEDPFLHQEMVEILYHVLWETVHVFLEHRDLGHDVGAAGFLYPFLTRQKQDSETVTEEVANSIASKVEEDETLREIVAETQTERISEAAFAISAQMDKGGKVIVFGNGGSATDANDFAIDCISPAAGKPSLPAISISSEPAILTALANDVGTDVLFSRQLSAHHQPNDIALGISTSGNSRNIVAALEEARKLGLFTVALIGCDGGEIARRTLADVVLTVPSNYIPRIQEIQASIYHTLIEALYELADGET